MTKNHNLLIILALTILGSSICAVDDLPFKKQQDVNIQKGPILEVDLTNLFDLSKVQYPLTVSSTPEAPYFTFKRPISSVNYQNDKELDISFSTRLDTSRVMVFSKKSLEVCLQTFSDVELITEKSNCFTLSDSVTGSVNDDPKPSDMVWSCEDAVYELSAEAWFVLCRGNGTEVTHNGLGDPISKFAIYGADNTGEAKSLIKLTQNDFKIKNRAKLLVFKNKGKKQEDAQYFNIISDSFLENGVDEPIELKIRVFTSLSFLSADNGEYTIKDTDNIIKEPREFFNFKNKLLLVSKRSDSGDKLCFTEIDYTFDSDRHESSFEVGSNFQCTK